MSVETSVPNLESIGFDIAAAKQSMLEQTENLTDISDRLMDEKVKATKFETAEYAELKSEVKQMYLLDLTQADAITAPWISSLNHLILCTTLSQYDAEVVNEGRFERDLPDLVPDAALSIKIKTNGEERVMFIGYLDSCQAYKLLGNYVASIKNAHLYLDTSGVLKEVKATNIEGVRIHV